VIDNDGGGIFSFLPQAQSAEVPVPEFELLFGTPHRADIGALAGAHGVPCERVSCSSALSDAVQQAIAAGGVRVVLVSSDRTTNVARHAAVWEAVRGALR
jgi:2-succinyl-5-enolpyruvyl-6-hydroxy-3-cyclohexene-1-carboxylate synthase